MHLKRSEMPKTWPVRRKGTKYLVRPKHHLKTGVPLLIILRDILKITKTRKEVKKLISLEEIKVNGKIVKDERFPLTLFDIISLDDKKFKLFLKNKRFNLIEVEGKQAEEKIAKVINKKILTKGKMQINLSDGRNYLSKEKIKTGDSVIINLKENKISEILPFKQGCRTLFITGKHLGKEGLVEGIDEKRKIVTLKIGDEKINSKQENLIVIK